MPSVYQTVFGGNSVAPAIPTYLPLTISANVVLGWPLESNITAPAVAEIIDVTATVAALTVQLSDARQVGTGYCALFNNVGANTFTLLDAQGNTLMAPAPGQAWQLYLADNSTLQGTWRVFQYGASVSTANAATLAGSGLKAIATTLNERIVINQQAVNYTILNSDRAACVEWTGGSGGTFTAPAPATVGSDWFCYIKNSGTGTLTLSGTIDGSTNKSFNPNDSCILVSDGTNLFTMGFGQSVASSFNFVTISLAGASGTVVLSGAQLNRISYKFTGAPANNVVVQVPASIQQYWVDNETTGAFTLTISAGGAGATFTVPQSTRVILYCDGLNIVNAVSTGAGSTTLVADGTAAAPGLAWASDTQMGLYKVGTDILGFSTTGTARGSINATGQWTINAPSSGVALTLATANAGAANSGNGISISGGNVAGTVVDIRLTMPGIDSVDLGVEQATGPYLACGGQLQFRSGGFTSAQNRMLIGGNGNVTINAPSSGDALTVAGTIISNTSTNSDVQSNFRNTSTGAAADYRIQLFNSTDRAMFTVTSTGFSGPFLSGGPSGEQTVIDTTAGPLVFGTSDAARVVISVNGNIVVSSPVSGNALVVNGASGTHSTRIADSAANVFDAGYLDTPLNTQAGNYTLVVSDRGKTIAVANGATITVPNAVFGGGAAVSFQIQSGSTATIAQGAGFTMGWAGNGATTGSRTFTGAGLATVSFSSTSAGLITGAGLS